MIEERRDISVERPSSRAQEFYARVDGRISVISDLWDSVHALHVPRVNDGGEYADRAHLDKVFDRAGKVIPDGFQKYQNTLDLVNSLRMVKPGEEREAIMQKIDELSLDPDVRFFKELRQGINNIISRRKEIRAMKKRTGHVGSNAIKEPVIKLHKHKDFQGHIRRMEYGRYSVTFYVDIDVLQAGRGDGALGFSEGLFNYVGVGEEAKIDHGIKETVKHENFHSFASNFRWEVKLHEVEEQYRDARVEPLNDERLRLLKLKKIARQIPDSSWEEVVAELVETDSRDKVPAYTFVLHQWSKGRLLDEIRSSKNPGEKMIGDIRLVDIQNLRTTIKEVYEMVDIHIPHRRKDLDVAFVLFPPSRSRYIKKLVEYWIRQENAEFEAVNSKEAA